MWTLTKLLNLPSNMALHLCLQSFLSTKEGVINRNIGFMTEEEVEGAVAAIMPAPSAPKIEPR